MEKGKANSDLQIIEVERICAALRAAYTLCQLKKRQIDKVCSDCRHVLKPWPRKKQAEKGTSNEKSPPNVVQEDKTAPTVPSEEQAGLSLVEKALAKAEKTRHKFLSKLEQDVAREEQFEMRRNKLGTTKSSASEAENVNPNISETSTVKSQLNVLQTNRCSSATKPQSTSKPVPQAKNIRAPVSTKRPDLSQNSRKTDPKFKVQGQAKAQSRPISGTASKQRYVPAHARAPFKTEPVVSRRGRGPVIQVRSAGRHSSSGSVPRSSLPNKPKSSEPTRHSLQSQDTIVPSSELQDTGPCSTGVSKSQTSVQVQGDPDISPIVTAVDSLRVSSDSQEYDSGYSKQSASIQPDISHARESEPSDSSTAEERFVLAVHGKQLSLPGKFNKLLAHNRRLREKVMVVAMTTSIRDQNSPAEEFMQKMQQDVDADKDESSNRLRKMLSLTALYNSLQTLLLEIPSTDQGEMEEQDVDWREIHQRKHKLYLVLTSFSSVESQYQNLVNRLSRVIQSAGLTPKDVTPDVDSAAHYWLPSEAGKLPLPPEKMLYRGKRQIITYTALVHQLQTLHWASYVLDQIQSVVDFFSKSDFNSNEVYKVFRSVYGTACSLGQTFPALVADSIDDVEDEQYDLDF